MTDKVGSIILTLRTIYLGLFSLLLTATNKNKRNIKYKKGYL